MTKTVLYFSLNMRLEEKVEITMLTIIYTNPLREAPLFAKGPPLLHGFTVSNSGS